MTAPIFKFRNIKVRLSGTGQTFIYGVNTLAAGQENQTLALGVLPSEVSSVILTVQVSNLTASTVQVSAYVQNSTSTTVFSAASARTLVQNYPLISANSFDPLSGNLAFSANDQLWIQTSVAASCDVVVSLLEIANATAS